MENWDALIELIDNELEERGWNRAELSRRSKVSEAHISRVMSQTYKPGPEFCEKIAKALDLPAVLVFEKAGILPTILTDDDPDFKIVEHLYYLLNKQDRQLLIDFAKMLKGRDDEGAKKDVGGAK
jgi:transcriptional regulator with XRE-family HTH domain